MFSEIHYWHLITGWFKDIFSLTIFFIINILNHHSFIITLIYLCNFTGFTKGGSFTNRNKPIKKKLEICDLSTWLICDFFFFVWKRYFTVHSTISTVILCLGKLAFKILKAFIFSLPSSKHTFSCLRLIT